MSDWWGGPQRVPEEQDRADVSGRDQVSDGLVAAQRPGPDLLGEDHPGLLVEQRDGGSGRQEWEALQRVPMAGAELDEPRFHGVVGHEREVAAGVGGVAPLVLQAVLPVSLLAEGPQRERGLRPLLEGSEGGQIEDEDLAVPGALDRRAPHGGLREHALADDVATGNLGDQDRVSDHPGGAAEEDEHRVGGLAPSEDPGPRGGRLDAPEAGEGPRSAGPSRSRRGESAGRETMGSWKGRGRRRLPRTLDGGRACKQ